MKSLNTYITEGGFFKNTQADKESIKEGIIEHVLNELLEINEVTHSCDLIVRISVAELVSRENIQKYFVVDDNLKLRPRSNDGKYGLNINMGYSRKWNKECLKKLSDVLRYFDPDDMTVEISINGDRCGVEMKDIWSAIKGVLPKQIHRMMLDNCRIDDWNWLDSVKLVRNLYIYNSAIKSFKDFNPEVIYMVIGAEVNVSDTNYFPRINRIAALHMGCNLNNNLRMVRKNLAPGAELIQKG